MRDGAIERLCDVDLIEVDMSRVGRRGRDVDEVDREPRRRVTQPEEAHAPAVARVGADGDREAGLLGTGSGRQEPERRVEVRLTLAAGLSAVGRGRLAGAVGERGRERLIGERAARRRVGDAQALLAEGHRGHARVGDDGGVVGAGLHPAVLAVDVVDFERGLLEERPGGVCSRAGGHGEERECGKRRTSRPVTKSHEVPLWDGSSVAGGRNRREVAVRRRPAVLCAKWLRKSGYMAVPSQYPFLEF